MDLALGITSAKAAWETLNIAVKARDAAKIEAATFELQKELLAMTDAALVQLQKNIQLASENADLKLEQSRLKEEKARLEQRISDDEKYTLHEFATGTFALKYDPTVETTAKPMHYLCLACKNDGRKSVLQPSGKSTVVLVCQVSKEHNIAIEVNATQPRPSRAVLDRGIDSTRW